MPLRLRNALLHTDPDWVRDRDLMLTTTQILSVAGDKDRRIAGAPDPWALSILDLTELDPIVLGLHHGLCLVLDSALPQMSPQPDHE